MSQAAKSEITIYLKDNVEVPLTLSSKTAIQQSMLKHYYATNPEAVGEPEILITECNLSDDNIEIELYSTRKKNLDFQVDLLQDFLNGDEFADIIEEVIEDTWVQI